MSAFFIALGIVVAVAAPILWFLFYGADAWGDAERDVRNGNRRHDTHFGLSKHAYDISYARAQHRAKILELRRAAYESREES